VEAIMAKAKAAAKAATKAAKEEAADTAIINQRLCVIHSETYSH